jgi:hypothetical protein
MASHTRDKKVIFVSHAHENEAEAMAIKKWLKVNLASAVNVFVSSDRKSNPTGSDWMNNVREHLEHADFAIYLMSPDGIESNWLHFEAGATSMKKRVRNPKCSIPIVPVCIGGVTAGSLPKPYDTLNAVTLPSDDGEAWLLKAVADEIDLTFPDPPIRLDFPTYDYTRRSSTLFTESQLSHYELSFQGRHIWVVSANLDHDIVNNGVFVEAVASNIEKKGINYTYVIPKRKEVAVRKQAIEATFKDQASKQPPKFITVESDAFDTFTETNITVYNPIPYRDAPATEVFIELPTDIDASKRCWVKVNKHFADKIVGKVNEWVNPPEHGSSIIESGRNEKRAADSSAAIPEEMPGDPH